MACTLVVPTLDHMLGSKSAHALCCALVLSACSVESKEPVTQDFGTGGATEATTRGSQTSDATDDTETEGSDESSGTSGSQGPNLCTPGASSFVYLLSSEQPEEDPEAYPVASLHRLDPETLEVTDLGALDCGAMAISLALAQDESLWSIMYDPTLDATLLVHIDPDTLACERVNDSWPDGFRPLGLAFAGNDDGTETLYTGGFDPAVFSNPSTLFTSPHQIVRVGLEPLDVKLMGPTELVPNEYYQGADLVGTGDGRLLGLYSNIAHIVEIDPTTPSITSAQEVGISLGSPWALTQWKGSAWIFEGGENGSTVRAFDLSTGELRPVSDGIGVNVVGAAASTCAPFTPEG